MSFSSVHRGGATRDLSVELRRLLLGSCGGGQVGLYPRRPVLNLPKYQFNLGERGGMFWAAASVCPARLPPMKLAPSWAHGVHCQRPPPELYRTLTIINSDPDETLNLA
eukprot:4593251-Pleurochrysis_carterae.AAC.1